MSIKWIGAILIIGGCGWTGCALAWESCREEKCLESLLWALRYMHWELQYRLTPLPELCRRAGQETAGPVGRVLGALAQLLEKGTFPEVSSCMRRAVREGEYPPGRTRELLLQLGKGLGRLDMTGQLEALEALEQECTALRSHLAQGRRERLRSYRTLGLCAGAALAILLA